MGSTTRAVLLSLAVHGVIAVVLGARTAPLEIDRLVEGQLVVEIAVDAADEPVVVALVDLSEPALAVGPSLPQRAAFEPNSIRPRAGAATTSALPVAIDPNPGLPKTDVPAGPGRRLAMRRGPALATSIAIDPSAAVGEGTVDPGPAPGSRDPRGLDFLKRKTPSLKAEPTASLEASGEGFKNDLGATTAKTDANGRVTFEDDRNFWIKLKLPNKSFLNAMIKSWQADPYKHATGQSEVEVPSDAIVGGGFDITDALMRSKKQDPYSAKKLAFLDRTRDERARVARNRQALDLRDAVAGMRKQLTLVWRRADLSVEARRRILFELWDECSERGTAAELAAADAARAAITGFIRRTLPPGSKLAYSKAELARLNKDRASARRFVPYAPTAR